MNLGPSGRRRPRLINHCLNEAPAKAVAGYWHHHPSIKERSRSDRVRNEAERRVAVRVGDCPLCNVSSVMFPRRRLLRRGRGWGWEVGWGVGVVVVAVGMGTREKGGRDMSQFKSSQVKYFFIALKGKRGCHRRLTNKQRNDILLFKKVTV